METTATDRTAEPRPTPPGRLPYGALALLDWLCEGGLDGRLVSTHHTGAGSTSCLMEVDPAGKHGLRRRYPFDDPALLSMLGGRDVTDLRALEGYGLAHFQRSLIEGAGRRVQPSVDPARLEAVFARHGREAFGYTDNVYMPTARTLELWAAGARAEAARRREERAAASAAVRRLVVIQAAWTPDGALPRDVLAALPKGFRFPLHVPAAPRPYAIAEVRRETPGRLYVGAVERLAAPGGMFSGSPVMGREPNVYVERAHVMADGIDRAAALRLAEVFREDARSRAEARSELVGRLAGVLEGWDRRVLQKDAELADMVAEALGREPEGPAPGRRG